MEKAGSYQEKREQERLEVEQRIARSFRAVFGLKGSRTEDQKMVMRCVEEWGWINRPYSQAGAVTTERILNLEGMREFALTIRGYADSEETERKRRSPKVDTSSKVGK